MNTWESNGHFKYIHNNDKAADYYSKGLPVFENMLILLLEYINGGKNPPVTAGRCFTLKNFFFSFSFR